MDNLNEANKKPSIPMLPSLGKKYSNFEAYLHSRISKNHYLYNEKYINATPNNTNQNHQLQPVEDNLLDGIIQCKTLLENQPTLESNSKFSISSSNKSNYINKDAGLAGENFSSNSRHTINNSSSNINIRNKKLAEINSEHEEKSNLVKSNPNINKCSNNCKPLNNNNKISFELEITTTTKHTRNYNNNNNDISNNSKLNPSSSSCNAINTDLINTTISHNMNTNNNNNSETKQEFKNLINNYSIEFDLPSNMLILSGKNYLNSCQINPNKNATNSIGRSSNSYNNNNNKCQNMLEGASSKLNEAVSDNEDADDADTQSETEEEQDKYLKTKLEEIHKQKLNANISKIPSEFLCTQQNSNINLDNRKVILNLKNALRSYCFKYSKKPNSLENFNTKIRNFNRIQMTKRRNELKSSSNKEKQEQTNFRKQSITGTTSIPLTQLQNTNTTRRSSMDKLVRIKNAQKEDDFDEIEEEILNVDDAEEELFYYENEIEDDEIVPEQIINALVHEQNFNEDDFIDDHLKEYYDTYEDHLGENKDENKKETKVSKINIEFFNRLKNKNKQNVKSSKKQQQQLNNKQLQQQLVMNEETDANTLAAKFKMKTNLDCEKSSLDTFAIVNSSANYTNKPKSKKNKNRKEENLNSSTALINNNINTNNETTTQKDELNKTAKQKSKSKKNINKTKTKELLVATSTTGLARTATRETASSSSLYSTSAKSETKTPQLLFNENQKQLTNDETDLNTNTKNNQLELDEEILKIEENELNLNNNNKINETNSRNSSKRNKLESNKNQNSSVEKRKFACTPPQTTITTIPSNIYEQQSNELNNSLNNNNYNNNNSNNSSNYNNNNIKHVFEKTSLLVRNFYKNFDLLKETQDLSEQIVSTKMYSSASSTTTTTATAPVVQQKITKQSTKNTLLTNSTSNLLINTAVGLNSTQQQQISPTSNLPPSIQQPHWVNIATMNAKSNSSNKLLSNDNTQSAIYLYSEMPLINTKQASRGHRNRKNSKLFHFRNGMNLDESLAVSPVRTTGEARLLKLASLQQKQEQPTSTSSKQIILLRRDKAGKLIPIEATATTSFKQQHTTQSIRNTEEAYLTENLSQDALIDGSSSNLNLNEYLKLPNLMKTKLSIEQLNKQATSTNRDPNYVLAQMTKYQRQNAINFLKLTNKNLADQLTGRTSLSSIVNNNATNTILSNLVTKSPELKPALLSTSPPPPNLPSTAPANSSNSYHTPILVRGNSFVAAKDLPNQIVNQQTQLSTLAQTNNLTKPKLSQIKFKSKNRPILISSISDFNLVNNNTNLNGLSASLLPSTLELVAATSSSSSSSNASNNDSNEILDNQINNETTEQKEALTSFREQTQLVETQPLLSQVEKQAQDESNEKQKETQHLKQTKKVNQSTKKFNLMDIEPTLNKCRGLYTYAATSSSQLKDAAFFSNNMKNTRSSINYLNYNTEAFLSNSTEDILASLLVAQQKEKKQQNLKQSMNGVTEIVTPIKVKNTSNNRQIFKDLEFIYNEQQVIKLQRQILIQIRQQNKLKQRMQQQQTDQQDDDEDDDNEETNRGEGLKSMLDQSLNNYRNLNSNYNYDYDVYKFYERNKTSLLLSSLQQQSKLKVNSTSNNTNNSTTNNKSMTKSTANLNDNNQEDDLDEEEETEIREDDNEDLVENTDNRNLINKRVKCES